MLLIFAKSFAPPAEVGGEGGIAGAETDEGGEPTIRTAAHVLRH